MTFTSALSAAHRVAAFAGQLVGNLVTLVAGMAFDPFPFDVMALAGGFEGLPQILVLDRFPRSGFPAIAFPAMNPLGQAVFDIGAVSVKCDCAGLLQRVESFDRRSEERRGGKERLRMC